MATANAVVLVLGTTHNVPVPGRWVELVARDTFRSPSMDSSVTPLQRLQALLRDLLQLDLSDLDFGIYRLLRVKRAEIDRFLEEQLPAAVSEAFGAAESGEREALEDELEELKAEVAEDALDANGSVSEEYRDVKVAAARELLADYESTRALLRDLHTSDEQRIEVFNHLHEFFRRYYEDGDFVPKRYYGRRERYAVPYDGEEVLLRWANRGQHYVKNAEVFKDYAFTVEGDLLAEPARIEDADGGPFDVILINGDSTVPGVRSLDPLFKAGLEAGTT